MKASRTAAQEHDLLLSQTEMIQDCARRLTERIYGPFTNAQREIALGNLQLALSAAKLTLRRYRRKALNG